MDIKAIYQLYQQHPHLTTDSRETPRGSIFLALRGERFDGNRFALQALEQGCAYAIADDATLRDTDAYREGRLIVVDDSLQTLKDLAREHRRQFDIPVIAITGTNGKTTTKELIAAVLSERFNVLYTEGNLNNDIGVPKTLLRLTAEHEVAVIEMGASHPGDIKTLVETAEPTCGLITNVGRAHLQGFGSPEAVARTKGELYDYLASRPDSLIFVNADDDTLLDLIDDESDTLWITPYSTDPAKQRDCISGGLLPDDAPYVSFRWREPLAQLEETGASTKWHKVRTQLVGDYNLPNLMAAVSVGLNFGVSRHELCHALESYVPSNSRSQLMDTENNRLIVDAYNANPTSMEAALRNFAHIGAARKMAILGDMHELGADSAAEHKRIAELAASTGDTELWLVGEQFARTDCPDARFFASVDDVKEAIAREHPTGRCILIKGSHSTRLYELPALL